MHKRGFNRELERSISLIDEKSTEDKFKKNVKKLRQIIKEENIIRNNARIKDKNQDKTKGAKKGTKRNKRKTMKDKIMNRNRNTGITEKHCGTT